MIKTFVLILVVSNGYRAGVSSLSTEFNSQEVCLAALNTIINEIGRTKDTRVVGSGCFPKE